MEQHRTLIVDGDEVEFRIKLSGQATAVSEGGYFPQPEPYLGATARRDGERTWSGVISQDVTYLVPVAEQFTDEELERLYRAARRH
jgi:hypothetical protein